jgi:hypothetical protein
VNNAEITATSVLGVTEELQASLGYEIHTIFKQ